jgi:mannan endo-1,4-beta-mannosidase
LPILFSCSINESVSSAQQLKEQLKAIQQKAILFGHQDDMAYGLGWKGIPYESDVKRVTGSYPAIFGWDLGNIGDANNLDGVPFDSIQTYIKRAHLLGGINTISWHARYPKTKTDAWTKTNIDVQSLLPKGENHQLFLKELDLVAHFIGELKDGNGNPIPIIFRPWHEMMGGWFWWGTATCTDQEYKDLFRFTIEYLCKIKKLDNLIIAFSLDGTVATREQMLQRYPGDDVVDIIGIDEYQDFTQGRLDKVVQKIALMVDLAKEKNKLAALTETGCDRLEIPNWYTTNLLQVLKASEKTSALSYVMVWRNSDPSHFYVPNLEHKESTDFKNFANDKMIFLLDEYNQIK